MNCDEIVVEKVKNGKYAIWECGSKRVKSGSSKIICDSEGRPKVPYIVKNDRRQTRKREHALIPVKKGDIIIYSTVFFCGDVESWIVEILRIKGFRKEGTRYFAPIEEVFYLIRTDYNWLRKTLPDKFILATLAGMEKARCSDCQAPHFVKSDKLCQNANIIRTFNLLS